MKCYECGRELVEGQFYYTNDEYGEDVEICPKCYGD